MALDINGYNDTFKAFLEFAKISESAGERKAIARATVDVKTGALAGREVTFSETDSVRGMFKWFRSADDKAANDTTRKIFKDAIIDMFGGSESKIPESVKKAMLLADYDKGKPLTARRITAVKVAVDKWHAEQRGSLNAQYAKGFVQNAMANLGVNLDAKAINDATKLVASYGAGIPEKNLSIFANYVVKLTAATNNKVNRDKVATLAADIKGWTDFDLNDPRLHNVGQKVAETANAQVQENFKTEHWFMDDADYQSKVSHPYLPNIADQFYQDITSGDWNFDGKTIKFDRKTLVGDKVPKFINNVLDQFNKTVDAKIETEARRGTVKKALTSLMHQGNFSDLEYLACKKGQLPDIKGADMFVSKRYTSETEWDSITSGSEKAVGLEISDDGKTATVTVSIAKSITFDGGKNSSSRIGTLLWAQKMTVDLTKDIPEVTNVTFSQKFSSDTAEITHDRIVENLQMKKTGANDILE